MKPKWQKLASLAQEICTLWFQFFGAVFASKGYPFKNIFDISKQILKLTDKKKTYRYPMRSVRFVVFGLNHHLLPYHMMSCLGVL